MCSFIYGCALSEPILGKYFELPEIHPPKRDLIYDKSHRQITDVRDKLNLFASNSNYHWISQFSEPIVVIPFVLLTGICLPIHEHRKIFCEENARVQRFR